MARDLDAELDADCELSARGIRQYRRDDDEDIWTRLDIHPLTVIGYIVQLALLLWFLI